MKILILGGTIFLGRHLVDSALSHGHTVSLFNRGKHSPELYPEVEKLRGDRDGDLSALEGRSWDAVIDTCGYIPRIVKQSADLLSGSCGTYTFISSISVFSDNGTPGMDESSPVGILDDTTVETVDGATYGPLKVLCEQAAEAAFPGRALVIRPGLIVGPFDPSDRFTYWPVRIAQGGDVLTPGDHSVPVQVIDGRDLAEWNIRMIEQGKTGIYNATGPEYEMSLGEMLEACRSTSASDARFVKVPETWLEENQVNAWSDIPAWVPDTDDMRGFSRISCQKAIGDGLTFRPIATIATDTLAWASSRPSDYVLKAGLKADREAELLEKWKSNPVQASGIAE